MSSIAINNGPSKFDLMTALFVWKPHRPTVKFLLDDGREYTASILGCSSEDGSGESWNIVGQLHDIYFGGGGKGFEEHAVLRQWYGFKGHFSTANRKGWLKLD